MISPFVLNVSGVAVVTPGPDITSPKVSAVAGIPSVMGVPHYSRPALTGTVDADLPVILCHLPNYPVGNTAVLGGGDTFGTHHSMALERCPTLYKGLHPFHTREHLHSNPPDNASDSNVEVSKPKIDILGCQTSTTLLLQATPDLTDLSTYKLCRLILGNARLALL